ncbi:AbfB domain-containing protein [Nostoc sp. FACHB-892]|uniref:AbfB domain-containing protein n=1 Tax=Nostoc sp. FACHB-892 TaxID=2692843 RepID=UPI001682562E|nr:AbfB domain-containing protein [Nostoc sp. FACHB-892]MBD2731986.1 AbfB domain-containing protein [Nostoc sp. FACHB-892]
MKNAFSALAIILSALPISISASINPAIAQRISIQSYNYPNQYIRHKIGIGEISEISSVLDRADATFLQKPGLASTSCLSFESSNFPGLFLRHSFGQIVLNVNNNTDLFRKDATFCLKPGLANSKSSVSFESYNYPTYYIRHKDAKLYIDPFNSNTLFLQDATFNLVAPLSP